MRFLLWLLKLLIESKKTITDIMSSHKAHSATRFGVIVQPQNVKYKTCLPQRPDAFLNIKYISNRSIWINPLIP